jgi:undecaprenyl-diphosphatase
MFEALEKIDRTILLAINNACHPALDEFFWQVSAGWIFVPVWILIMWYIYKQKGIRYIGITLLCIGFVILFCDQSTNLVKNSVKRYRPTHNLEICGKIHVVNDYRGGQYGFFSGHSSNTTGVAVFIFLLLGQLKVKYRWLIFLWPAVTEYSRMYLGVHYPSDIFFGTLDGILWGIIFFKVFDYLKKRKNVEVA